MKAIKFFDDRFEDAYTEIFREMCRRVGADFDTIELKPDGARMEWPFNEYSWTIAEEEAFVIWLVDHFYMNRRLLYSPRKRKADIRKHIVPMFMLNYGWRTDYEHDSEGNEKREEV